MIALEALKKNNPDYVISDDKEDSLFFVQVYMNYEIIDQSTEYVYRFVNGKREFFPQEIQNGKKQSIKVKARLLFMDNKEYASIQEIKENEDLKKFLENEKFLNWPFVIFEGEVLSKIKPFRPNSKNVNIEIPEDTEKVIAGQIISFYIYELMNKSFLKKINGKVYKVTDVLRIYSFICFGKQLKIEKII